MKLKIVLMMIAALGVGSLQGADPAEWAASAARYASGQSSVALQRLDDLIRDAAGDPEMGRRLERALILMLGPESTVESKLFACQRLAVVGTVESIPALSRLMQGEETVGMACLALANLPTPKADVVLRRALKETSGIGRLQVIATLGNRRDSGASRALSKIAGGDDQEAAAAATIALARIADRRARKTLASMRRTPLPGMRTVMDEASLLEAESLVAEGRSEAAAELYETMLRPEHPAAVRAGALAALLRAEPGQAEARIHSVLRGDNPSLLPDAALRSAAIAAVGELRSATSGLVFAGELDRLPVSERVLLIQALADLGPQCPRRALAAQLSSESVEVRRAVIRAFAGLNAPGDWAVFVKALAVARGAEERLAAEAALVMLPGGPGTDEVLLAQVVGASPEVRGSLLTALARRGAPGAVPALFEAASSPEEAMARCGFQGLGLLAGPAELPALLDLYGVLPEGPVRDDAEGAVARVLGRMPDAAGRGQAVCAKLESAATLEARLALIRILPLAGGLDALTAVRAAVGAEDAQVRDAGVRALAQWTDLSATDDLMAVYADAEQPAHRALALRALAGIADEANRQPGEALVLRYARMLSLAKTDEERRLILGALGGCADPVALRLALEQRELPGVRGEADQAVKRIAGAIRGTHPEAATAALEKVGLGE